MHKGWLLNNMADIVQIKFFIADIKAMITYYIRCIYRKYKMVS